MFRNYLLVTFRNLYKNKVYALINILGLGMALAICIVAFFNHMFGHDFDRWHENFDEIYRVNPMVQLEDREQEFGSIPALLGPRLEEDVPGVERAVRLFRSYSPVKVGIDNYNRQISYVDPEFLDMFTFYMVAGSKEVLHDPNMVLVSEQMAEALYGGDEAIGKAVSIFNDDNKEYIYTIGAIFRDLPLNSSFRIDILTHKHNFLHMWNQDDTNWKTMARALFIQVPDAASLPVVSTQLDSYLSAQNKANEDFKVNSFRLIPLEEVNKNSRVIWNNGLMPGLHPAAVIAPLVMAITMLLIACFNFANTAVATSGKRLMEIGIRKMVGGERRQLLIQFLIENYVVCSLALLVAVAGAAILVPAYSSMWDYMYLKLSFTQYPAFLPFLLLLLLLTGFLAGAYPALYISSFRPLKILQSRTRLGKGGPLATVLLGFQFTISVLSIVSGVIFTKNAIFQDTLDLGFKRKELIVVPMRHEFFPEYYDAMVRHPKLIQAGGTQEHIGWGWYTRSFKDENSEYQVRILDVGPRYLQAMGLELLDGRLLDPDRLEADRGNSIVINETMVRAFGWENPVGKRVHMNDTIPYRVIGVVKDFYTAGLWVEIEPSLLKLATKDEYYHMAIRAKAEDLPEILEYAQETWREMIPNYPFTGRFQEDLMEEERNINRSIKQMYIFLSIVATLLAMIGLYTLVSLSILNRTKEIGIRKVMGSPVSRIWLVLSKRFLINLALSSAIGCFGGYYLSKMMIQSIWKVYLDFTADIYIYSVLLMFVITALTITSLIYRAAHQNPVTCLRYE